MPSIKEAAGFFAPELRFPVFGGSPWEKLPETLDAYLELFRSGPARTGARVEASPLLTCASAPRAARRIAQVQPECRASSRSWREPTRFSCARFHIQARAQQRRGPRRTSPRPSNLEAGEDVAGKRNSALLGRRPRRCCTPTHVRYVEQLRRFPLCFSARSKVLGPDLRGLPRRQRGARACREVFRLLGGRRQRADRARRDENRWRPFRSVGACFQMGRRG